MAVDVEFEAPIRELEVRLTRAVDGHPPLTLTPAWWQQRLLQWATADPDFRVKLLQFVDVLPALRTGRAIADHVRQYFRGAGPPLAGTASGLAAQPIFRPVLSQVVRQGVFGMAHRFIAGATPEEAIPALRDLARQGVASTVDLLGEETLSAHEADVYLQRYTDVLQTLSAHADTTSPHGEIWRGIPPVNISVKLSALCDHLEPAAPGYVSRAIRERLRPLMRLAVRHGAFINFDMEQYRYKDIVHQTFADLVMEPEFAGYGRLGIVVQAYLRDSEEDVARLRLLAQRRGAPLTIRLVKGAYWDEENIVADQNSWPAPVYTRKEDTDASFERCTELLLAAWPHLRPAFGSHSPHSVAQAIAKSRRAGLADNDIEFQMLYGMAEGLRLAVAAEGFRTRAYVPVGQVIPGMAYLVRRLLENTSNQAWFNTGVAKGEPPGRPVELPPISGTAGAFRNAPPAQFFLPEVRERMRAALDGVRARFGDSYPLLIGGRSLSGRPQAEVRYPAEPGTIIGKVAQATREDADQAARTAWEAFPEWRDTPAKARAEILRRAAGLMEERRFDLAATMVFESAKPWHEADGDVVEAIDYLRYYGEQAERLERPQVIGDVLGERNEYFYEGRGPTAVIAPWNFPLAIITGMSAGALAGGCPAILKPAGQSPIIAYKLVRLLREAGVPEGVAQYVPGPGSEVGQALVEHPLVANIAFTGSNAVGLGMIEAAARTRPGQPLIKRVIAELGGKNAVIIDEDADLDQAVRGALVSAFGYAGQKCSACSRLIIVGSAYGEAIERLREGVRSLAAGPPHDPATFVPPVISASARDNIMSYIESAKGYATLFAQTGISHLTGASSGEAGGNLSTINYELSSTPGHYVAPTVFTDVPLDAPLACDEVFGPVLAVFRAGDFEEAINLAMDSRYALTGGVFSRNPRHIEMARKAFRAGNLYINRKITGAIAGRQPFGGRGMSGIGEKAGGPDYVRQFMEPRTVTENTMRRGFAPEQFVDDIS